MLNIKLPANFNSPYKAKDIHDFWRRWHITLSKFLRDYIYIPLGGNRVSNYRNSFNLFSVFLIGGLWHGASWMFVLWGALHGIAMVIHRIWKDIGFKMNSFMAWFITFNFINITWVFFRAKHWDDALKVLGGMFGGEVVISYKLQEKWEFLSHLNIKFGGWLPNIAGDQFTYTFLFIALLLVLFTKSSTYYFDNFNPSKKLLLISTLSLTFVALMFNKISEFIYFNF